MSLNVNVLTKQITIYGATPIFIAGVLGGLLNTLVFLSLRTFRESSCAFYLTIMSVFNIGQLFLGLFSRITMVFLGIDGTETSLFYCKTRPYLNQVCIGTSLVCLCLATIDQYFATCSRPRWQQWCNIILARRLIIITILFWMCHGIPYFVFYEHVTSTMTQQTTCVSTNALFTWYRNLMIVSILFGYLPAVITAIFGSMAYRNVQEVAYRTVPLVRRELDKQLTVMVLVHVAINIFTLLPYVTVTAISTYSNVPLALTVTLIIYYVTFAVSVI